MKKLFLSIMLLMTMPSVFAATEYFLSGQSNGPFYSSAQAACNYVAGTGSNGVVVTVGGQLTCRLIRNSDGANIGEIPILTRTVPDLPQCLSPAGTRITWSQQRGTGPAGADLPSQSLPYPASSPDCGLQAPPDILNCESDTVGNVQTFYCTYEGISNGQASPPGTPSSSDIPADSTPSDVPPFEPPEGQGCPSGTVNMGTGSSGTPICGGKGESPNTPTKTETSSPPITTNNPDGSTTKTETSTRTNSDGSSTTTTKTTTTRPDGSTTTSTSSQTGTKPSGAGGGQGKDDSSDDKKDDFCLKHPELNVCKNSTVKGSCESVLCTGDAIACMIAKQSAEINCREKAAKEEIDQSPLKTLGAQAAGGNDPLGSTLPTKANATPYAMPTSIESTGWLGGGSCFQDKSFSYMGRTVVIPMSSVCDPLLALRFIMMIVASLISYRMLSGVILRD